MNIKILTVYTFSLRKNRIILLFVIFLELTFKLCYFIYCLIFVKSPSPIQKVKFLFYCPNWSWIGNLKGHSQSATTEIPIYSDKLFSVFTYIQNFHVDGPFPALFSRWKKEGIGLTAFSTSKFKIPFGLM